MGTLFKLNRTSVIMMAMFFAACGKVEFNNSLSSLQKNCVNGCWEGQFNPQENIEKPEIKVVLVVDNSFSMTQAQEKLAVGVRSLIDGLKGFTATYHLYTTTQVGDKNASQIKSGCRKFKNGITTDLLSCPADGSRELGAIYTKYDDYQLAPSLILGTDFKISDNSTDAEFSNLKNKISTAITSVGTSGSDSEQGVCTLLRSIYEEGPNKILNPGDFAVFGLISDEEDFSSAAECFSSRQTQIDCREEDQTPITKTRNEVCTRDDCKSFPVTYSVQLGARDVYSKKITYQRRRTPYYVRTLAWQELGAQTYHEAITFSFSVAQPNRDGVPQPALTYTRSPTRDITTACVAASGSCSAAQIAWSQAMSESGGGVYIPGSCVVNSCTANAAPTVANKTRTLSSEPNCDTWSESQCAVRAGTSNYVAGSCATNSCTVGTLTTEDMTFSTAEVDTCSATACSASTLSSINPGSGWEIVDNSCQVSCSPVNYPAVTKTYAIDHITPNSNTIAAQSYCSNSYGGKANLGIYSSENSNMRPVISCAITNIGAVKYKSETVTYQELPPPGTPKCVTANEKKLGYPLNSVVQSNSDLIQAFRQGAASKFQSNYFVSAIIHNSASDLMCPIMPGQSVGSRYSQLTGLQPELGLTASICEADYGAALENATNWIRRSMNDTYIAPNVDGNTQEILEMWIVRGTQTVTIPAGAVEIAGARIKFARTDMLQAGDLIRYIVRKKK